MPRIRLSNKQPALLADSRWTDRALAGTSINLNAPLNRLQFLPPLQCISDLPTCVLEGSTCAFGAVKHSPKAV